MERSAQLLQTFVPSHQLRQQAQWLVKHDVPNMLTRISAMMQGEEAGLLQAKHMEFLQLIGEMKPNALSDDIHKMIRLIADIAESNTSKVNRLEQGWDSLFAKGKGVKSAQIFKVIDDAQRWCLKAKAKYDALNDMIDDTATDMASNLHGKTPKEIRKIAAQVHLLDAALGHLVEINAFAGMLLKEINAFKQSYVTRLQDEPRQQTGHGPMAM